MGIQSKRKILYILTKSNFGGAQRYVYELAVAMKQNGHIVAVACGGDGELIEKLSQSGIQVYGVKNFQRNIHIGKELRSMYELVQIIRNFNPDIVHLNSSKAGGSGALISRIAGIHTIVFTAHGWPFLEPRNIFWRTFAWFASYLTALLAHRIILVSNNDLAHTNMPFVQHKCTVIRTAVPIIDFKKCEDARAFLFSKEMRALHKNDTWLITNAELNHNKNLFPAIDAVIAHNTNNKRKIFYSIIGDGELIEELHTYIRKKKTEDQIVLLGHIMNSREFLNAFDIFLLSSKKEGMPYALIEAGASKLPCVASNVGGIPEIIEHEKNGLLVDPNDRYAITNALTTLSNSAQMQRKYGTNLQKKITQHFSFKNMLTETITIYN